MLRKLLPTVVLLIVVAVAPGFAQVELYEISHLSMGWSNANDVEMSDELMLIPTGYSGLHFIDISDPSAPFEVSYITCNDYFYRVKATDNIAYAIGNELSVIDFSDVDTPELITQIQVGEYPLAMDLFGDYLVVSVSTERGMIITKVFAIHNRINPVLLGEFEINANHIRLVDDLMYVMKGNTLFSIYDFSDPENIEELVEYDLVNRNIFGMDIRGDFAFLIGAHSLTTLDISDTDFIAQLDYITLDSENSYNHISFENEYAFLGGSGNAVIDISQPDELEIVSEVFNEIHANGIIAEDDYLYIAEEDVGLTILDVSNPENIVPEGAYDMVGYNNIVLMHDDLLFTSGGMLGSPARNNLHIYSIEDPQNPVLLADMQFSDYYYGSAIWSMAAEGDFLYLAGQMFGQTGFYTINIADPTDPQVYGIYENYRWMEGGTILRGDRAYVNCDVNGMFVFDISDPAEPVALGNDPYPPEYALDFEVIDNYALIYGGGNPWVNSIRILDVTDPANMVEVGDLGDELLSFNQVEYSNEYLYVAQWNDPLRVYDIRDVTEPQFLFEYEDPGMIIQSIAIEDTLLWGCTMDNMCVLYDISSPLEPELLATTVLPVVFYQVDAQNGISALGGSWETKLMGFDITPVEDGGNNPVLPSGFSMSEAFPNPFNSSTRLTVSLPSSGNVNLTLFDILGRNVWSQETFRPAGTSTIAITGIQIGNKWSTGQYFVRANFQGFSQTRKVVLIK